MTLARYYAAVAVVYFAAFLAVALLLGGLAEDPTNLRLWSLPFMGAGVGLFGTWAAIGRFGDLGGSIFFSPTLLHVLVLLVLAFAVLRTGYM